MTTHRYAGWFVCGMLLTMGGSRAMADGQSVDTFLSRHWQRPLPYQGETPFGFSPLETSLDPQACGSCHPRQLQDWQGSLHAHAMGPGLLGQLREMDPSDRTGHQACLRYHAPLAEQANELAAWITDDKTVSNPPTDNTEINGSLYRQGLICAACHQFEADGFALSCAVHCVPPKRQPILCTSEKYHCPETAHCPGCCTTAGPVGQKTTVPFKGAFRCQSDNLLPHFYCSSYHPY